MSHFCLGTSGRQLITSTPAVAAIRIRKRALCLCIFTVFLKQRVPLALMKAITERNLGGFFPQPEYQRTSMILLSSKRTSQINNRSPTALVEYDSFGSWCQEFFLFSEFFYTVAWRAVLAPTGGDCLRNVFPRQDSCCTIPAQKLLDREENAVSGRRQWSYC